MITYYAAEFVFVKRRSLVARHFHETRFFGTPWVQNSSQINWCVFITVFGEEKIKNN